MDKEIKEAFDTLEQAAMKNVEREDQKAIRALFVIGRDFYDKLSWFLAKR